MKKRLLSTLLIVGMINLTTGCGLILHPERQKRTPSHHTDVQSLVFDCLWLLVGVIPGVVALAVDYGSQTVFYSQGEARASAGDTITINIAGIAPNESFISLQMIDFEGCELARSEIFVSVSNNSSSELSLTLPKSEPVEGAKLVLSVDDQPQVSWALHERV